MGKIYVSQEAAAPTNPAAGKSVIYPKTDGFWYYRNETGAEVQVLNSAAIPLTANTYLRRNSANAAFDAKTPQQVADELSPLQKFGPRNYIIGGDFSTNPWQRGTSFAGVSSTVYTADRFAASLYLSGTYTIAKIADAPAFAQAGRHITHCLEALVTTADTSVAANEVALIDYPIEGYDYLPLYQKPQLVGLWAKSNLIGTYGIALRGAADTLSYVGSITINAVNTWEYKTLAVTSAPVGGTWNFTNGTGAKVSVTLVSGTTYQTATLGSWLSGNFIAPTTQANLAATVNNYFRIADVKLVEGLVDLASYQPTEEEVLTACQRYYHAGTYHARFPAAAANQFHDTAIYFPVKMRTAPTMASTAGARNNLSAIIIDTVGPSSARLSLTSAAAGDTYALNEPYTASADL